MDASVPDIALEPDKTVRKVQDKFRLDLNDEEALRYMQNLIDVSAAAVMAALVEQLHKIAQYWRKWYASLLLFVCGKKFLLYLFVYLQKKTDKRWRCLLWNNKNYYQIHPPPLFFSPNRNIQALHHMY